MQVSWLTDFYTELTKHNISSNGSSEPLFEPVQYLEIGSDDWGKVAQLCDQMKFRWSACWGDQISDQLQVYALLLKDHHYLMLMTTMDLDCAELPSQSKVFLAADRPERHVQDLYGIKFKGGLDTRRWTRHQAWDEKTYPLRNEFPLSGQADEITGPDNQYPFKLAKGSGVYEIAVGPVHAGIIEPGHFRFNAVGEDILSIEEHLGYTHKGIEKLAEGKDIKALIKLAARVSGDTTVAHSWAACQAIENATETQVPERALWLRGLLCERERVANHLGDIGAICNDVGFGFANAQCSVLRELWQRSNKDIFGHRLLIDTLIAGGVKSDIDNAQIEALNTEIKELRSEIKPLFDLLIDIPSLEDRLLKTGFFSTQSALKYGCTGYVAKASGINNDVRLVAPYSPYDHLPIDTPVLDEGDVMARVQIRMREIRASLEWMELALLQLKPGKIQTEISFPDHCVKGLGIIEGWRGETLAFVRFDENRLVSRYFARDPSWLLWPALEKIVMGNIVPDFPVCNKSVNGSYSGQDL